MPLEEFGGFLWYPAVGGGGGSSVRTFTGVHIGQSRAGQSVGCGEDVA